MSKTLTMADILSCENDVTIEAVELPKWGGTAYMRSINGNQRDKWELSFAGVDMKDRFGMRASLVAICICDENGTPLAPSDVEVEALGRRNAEMLDKAFDVCQRINGMREEDYEDKSGNSGSANDDASG